MHEEEQSLQERPKLFSQYQRMIRGIGERGHFSDLYVEFSPSVGGVIKSTRVYGETSLHREFHFNGLGELDQIDIFRQVKKERDDMSNENESEIADHLTLKRGDDRRFFIDRRDMRPPLLEKWYLEHPKYVVPVKQLSREEFSVLLKTSLLSVDMKQKDLARKLGVSEQTISRWITRQNQPKQKQVEFLFDFFHWDRDAILSAAFQSSEGLIIKHRRSCSVLKSNEL